MQFENKILLENIKHFRHLITEGVGEDGIIDAIENHEWLYIYYEGDGEHKKGHRTIRPYVLGTSKAGNPVLRAWQDNPKNSFHFDNKPTRPKQDPNMADSKYHDYWTDEEGMKPGWRMFRLDKITKVYPIGKKFHDSNGAVMIPSGYHEGADDDMTSIKKFVSTKKQPDMELRYRRDVGVEEIPKMERTKQKWDSIRRGNTAKRKITANDVTKLRDIASNVYKKNRGSFLVVIDDKNNFQLILGKDKDKQQIPDTAIVGSLANLYDSIVKGNAPADSSFFNDMKNKAQTDLERKKQQDMDKGFSTIQEVEKNSPSIPFERKPFFKQ